MLNDGFLGIALVSALGFVISEVTGAMLGPTHSADKLNCHHDAAKNAISRRQKRVPTDRRSMSCEVKLTFGSQAMRAKKSGQS